MSLQRTVAGSPAYAYDSGLLLRCITLPAFPRGKGKEKLDDVLKHVYRMTREEFLNKTGDWMASHYGQDQ